MRTCWSPPQNQRRAIESREILRISFRAEMERFFSKGLLGGNATPLALRCYTTQAARQSILTSQRRSPKNAKSGTERHEISYWSKLITRLSNKADYSGVMSCFRSMVNLDHGGMLILDQAKPLLHKITAASTNNDEWTTELIQTAEKLRETHGFNWPNIYSDIVRHYLHNGRGDLAFFWHLKLSPKFPPSANTVKGILVDFVEDISPGIQSALKAIYVFSPERKLYDVLIPQLYGAGKSKLARQWRKTCLLYNDLPSSAITRPFLRFLATYHPGVPLDERERQLAELSRQGSNSTNPRANNTDQSSSYTDGFIAKWFASSWTSVEFAINLVSQLGVQSIGSRSLQALALRQPDSADLLARLKQLRHLQIGIPSNAYSSAISYFVKERDDESIAAIVNCDIHPDEFDDAETRNMILQAAIRTGDHQKQRLLENINLALGSSTVGPNAQDASVFSFAGPRTQSGVPEEAAHVLPESEPRIPQAAAITVLRSILDRISVHNKRILFAQDLQDHVDLAITATFRMARSRVAIPTQFWRRLLQVIGRSDRSGDLEKVCLALAALYKPNETGLIAIHGTDIPGAKWSFCDEYHPYSSYWSPGVTADKDMTNLQILEKANIAQEMKPNPEAYTERQQHIGRDSDAFFKLFNDRRTDLEPGKVPGVASIRTVDNELGKLLGHWNENGMRVSKTYRQRIRDTSPKNVIVRSHFGYTLSEREYIPSDLPFSHRQHPLQKIFDSTMQRRIIRWGFDHAVKKRPVRVTIHTLDRGDSFDVASGVRTLAMLRDEGVLVDIHLVRSSVVSRIAVSQIPGRRVHYARDTTARSMAYLVSMMNIAWGSKLFESAAELNRKVEARKIQVWGRYSKMYQQREAQQRKGLFSAEKRARESLEW